MVRQWLIIFCTRLARAVLIRLAEDVEIMQVVHAGLSSAKLASNELSTALPLQTREELLLESLKRAHCHGLVCEFGVYRGATLSLIANARQHDRVYGFDSFEGLPDVWRPGFPDRTFKIDPENLPHFPDNVKLYRGLFHESLPRMLQDDARMASFLHVDCDLYSSTRCVFDLMSSRLQPGTVIVFDEYFNYPGWEKHEHRALIEAAENAEFTFEYLFYNPRRQQVSIIIRTTQSKAV